MMKRRIVLPLPWRAVRRSAHGYRTDLFPLAAIGSNAVRRTGRNLEAPRERYIQDEPAYHPGREFEMLRTLPKRALVLIAAAALLPWAGMSLSAQATHLPAQPMG